MEAPSLQTAGEKQLRYDIRWHFTDNGEVLPEGSEGELVAMIQNTQMHCERIAITNQRPDVSSLAATSERLRVQANSGLIHWGEHDFFSEITCPLASGGSSFEVETVEQYCTEQLT